jgi:hypothetical protein
MMEAAGSSKTLVNFYKAVWWHITQRRQ